jgi:hypothetical protein
MLPLTTLSWVLIRALIWRVRLAQMCLAILSGLGLRARLPLEEQYEKTKIYPLGQTIYKTILVSYTFAHHSVTYSSII